MDFDAVFTLQYRAISSKVSLSIPSKEARLICRSLKICASKIGSPVMIYEKFKLRSWKLVNDAKCPNHVARVFLHHYLQWWGQGRVWESESPPPHLQKIGKSRN